MAVIVKIQSEYGTSRDPAKVLVYENDRLVAEVIAEVELKQGADGGWYHCVTLKIKAKMVLHHDDPPCTARLSTKNGGRWCPKCELHPNMQSTLFYFYCPFCDMSLKNLKCSNCKQVFEHPAP